jgi:hypothetical protein
VNFFELQIDFFLPVWRRVAVILVCFVWAMVEFGSGAPLWGTIFASLGIYAVWQFFLTDWPATGTASKSSDTASHSPSEESD